MNSFWRERTIIYKAAINILHTLRHNEEAPERFNRQQQQLFQQQEGAGGHTPIIDTDVTDANLLSFRIHQDHIGSVMTVKMFESLPWECLCGNVTILREISVGTEEILGNAKDGNIASMNLNGLLFTSSDEDYHTEAREHFGQLLQSIILYTLYQYSYIQVVIPFKMSHRSVMLIAEALQGAYTRIGLLDVLTKA